MKPKHKPKKKFPPRDRMLKPSMAETRERRRQELIEKIPPRDPRDPFPTCP